ncbi:MAG: 2-succinyl-5-enolpyruvyl-6-hydroxy-3-cyclohexene-1-carboxylic-acid synthase [Tannerellaceae bacterium]|jgi:2-succinyl-5-enolpyruvyl-6-hydroxy-3-cyclohexene-1-carboxylate synthase|nr:2-succinyl-5-enolpyruvyl-6-hydroxy-3-cyclohexene-1-carboxylic-acid synthase [Tannerellaceae bacterium]
MYSRKKNIQQLVGLLKAHRVSQVVVSPGSRNLPIVQSLAGDGFFTCHTVVDERSAGFFAIGIAQYRRETVAVCCTSGTAVLNYAPAVAEAFYQQVPLVVITADRPASLIGQMTGQTLPQQGVFGALVKGSFNLPDVVSEDDERYCNRLVNEALLETCHRGHGPVHINVPVSEPLYEYSGDPLPAVRAIRRAPLRTVITEEYGARFLSYKKVMLILGQSAGYNTAGPVMRLTRAHDCVVLAEHLCGASRMGCVGNFDVMMAGIPRESLPSYAPELLITTGGHIVSKLIKQFLIEYPPLEHWHASPSGKVVDTYQCLTDIIESDGAGFIDFLAMQTSLAPQERSYSMLWHSGSKRLPEPDVEFSDIMAVGALLKALPKTANLQLANSNAVRLAQLFGVCDRTRVFSNRGTSGIDGCLSTAMGQAAVSKELTFVVIGDLAFFYDINILWNRPVPRLRIMLNNNGGGGIFHTLPGLGMSDVTRRHTVVEHASDAKDWAESRGLVYLPVTNAAELESQMPVFTGESADKPMLMEVFTSAEENAEILRRYYARPAIT